MKIVRMIQSSGDFAANSIYKVQDGVAAELIASKKAVLVEPPKAKAETKPPQAKTGDKQK